MRAMQAADRGSGRVPGPKRAVARCAQPQDQTKNAVAPAFVATVGTALSVALPALASDAGVSADAVTAVGAIAGVAGLGGVLIATDPQRRRSAMAEGAGGDEMASVKEYFETSGAVNPCLQHTSTSYISVCCAIFQSPQM